MAATMFYTFIELFQRSLHEYQTRGRVIKCYDGTVCHGRIHHEIYSFTSLRRIHKWQLFALFSTVYIVWSILRDYPEHSVRLLEFNHFCQHWSTTPRPTCVVILRNGYPASRVPRNRPITNDSNWTNVLRVRHLLAPYLFYYTAVLSKAQTQLLHWFLLLLCYKISLLLIQCFGWCDLLFSSDLCRAR